MPGLRIITRTQTSGLPPSLNSAEVGYVRMGHCDPDRAVRYYQWPPLARMLLPHTCFPTAIADIGNYRQFAFLLRVTTVLNLLRMFCLIWTDGYN